MGCCQGCLNNTIYLIKYKKTRQDETSKKHKVGRIKDLVTNKNNYQKNIDFSTHEVTLRVFVLLPILQKAAGCLFLIWSTWQGEYYDKTQERHYTICISHQHFSVGNVLRPSFALR